MYRAARQACGLSREEAAFRLHVGSRTLANYEAGETIPPPEVVLAMSLLYQQPWLTQHYCRRCCAIGQAYSYEILNAINDDLPSVLLSLQEELEEASAVLLKLMKLARNKRSQQDFNEKQWLDFKKCLGELLDVEHNVEVLKLTLGNWCDVAELVREHNRKCIERGYVRKKRELATLASS